MLALTKSPIGRLATTAVIALPLALLACGGENQSSIPVAEARPVAPATPVTTESPSPVSSAGATVIPRVESADDAYRAGEYRHAAELFRAHVESRPSDAHGYYMLGLSSWKSGDLSSAREAFDRSIALDPTFAKSYFNQARVLLESKRAPEALEMIEKGRGIDSTSSDGWRLKARAQSESGDVEGAMKTYRELLVRDDADAWGLNNLGVLLMDGGKLEESLGPLARAVQVKPTAPLFQNNLGMALERSGFKVAALHHYELAVRSDSTFTKAVKNVERLGGVVTDRTLADEVDVQQLAERFRQVVKTWKEDGQKGEGRSPHSW